MKFIYTQIEKKMKKNILSIKFYIITVFLLGLTGNAYAAVTSSFNTSQSLLYTINSITNIDQPGNLNGLNVLGEFDLDQGQTFVDTTGDGASSITHSSFFNGPVTGNTLSNSFGVNGSASGGSVDVNYLTLSGLGFENTSSNQFEINVDLSYVLNVETDGATVHSEINIDYFEELNGTFGFDSVLSDGTSSDNLQNTVNLLFNLNPGETQWILADINHQGSLTQVATVPIPVTAWLFVSGLIGMGRYLRQRTT